MGVLIMPLIAIYENGELLAENPALEVVQVLLHERGITACISPTWAESVPEWNTDFGLGWEVRDLPADWQPPEL
jgi:hypothetical protein